MGSVAIGAALLLAAGAGVHAQSPVTVDLTGRLQFQWNSTSVDDEEIGERIASNT